MAAQEFPGQSEAVKVEPFTGAVTVAFSDAIIASTDRALRLSEQGHEPVFYIPFEDIYFDHLEKTNTTTRCPRKGTASYWRVTAVGESADDVMWAYETPDVAAARPIAGHGAFDKRRVRIEVAPAPDEHEARLIE